MAKNYVILYRVSLSSQVFSDAIKFIDLNIENQEYQPTIENASKLTSLAVEIAIIPK